jgi:hypothetical protein
MELTDLVGSLLPLDLAPDGRNLRSEPLTTAPDASDEQQIDHRSDHQNAEEECNPAPSVHMSNLLALSIGISHLAQESLQELGHS